MQVIIDLLHIQKEYIGIGYNIYGIPELVCRHKIKEITEVWS